MDSKTVNNISDVRKGKMTSLSVSYKYDTDECFAFILIFEK